MRSAIATIGFCCSSMEELVRDDMGTDCRNDRPLPHRSGCGTRCSTVGAGRGWNPGVEWMTVEGPLVSGRHPDDETQGAPQTAFRIEAAVPERLLALVMTIGPLAAMRFRWELSPVDGGTSIAQTVAIAGPLAGVLLRKTALRIAGGCTPTSNGSRRMLAARSGMKKARSLPAAQFR